MSVLCPTPREHMLDAAGRPYFLWDTDMTLEDIQEVWAQLRHRLGRTREFWSWWMERWDVAVDG